MRSLPIALAAAIAAATVSLACGQDEEAVPPEATAAPTLTPVPAFPTPAVKGQLWRWVNVTLVLPEGSPVTIGRGTIPEGLKGAGGPGMGPTIDHGGVAELASYVVIDAVTGEILQDRVSAEDRAAIDEVLKTIAVNRFDEADKGWPYQDALPAASERQVWGGMSYVIPDPASGVTVGGGINDPGGPFIEISNGRSKIGITLDAETGELSPYPIALSPQDEAPFDRYLAAIQICGRDVQC